MLKCLMGTKRGHRKQAIYERAVKPLSRQVACFLELK